MSLEEALNIIVNGDPVIIVAVRAQGKKQGELYSKRCRYGAPDGHQRLNRSTSNKSNPSKPRNIGLHIDAGTIPMTEIGQFDELNDYFSPNIYHIIEINGHKIFK